MCLFQKNTHGNTLLKKLSRTPTMHGVSTGLSAVIKKETGHVYYVLIFNKESLIMNDLCN